MCNAMFWCAHLSPWLSLHPTSLHVTSPHFISTFIDWEGRAITQAVSTRLPTAAARVRCRVWSCGICGGQSGTEAGFLWVLRFPLPIFIPPTAPHSSSRAGTTGQTVADVPSGLGLTPTPKKRKLTEPLQAMCQCHAPVALPPGK
jgi:hypothetical protein